MNVIILAAGKGERLWPLTKYAPKPLLKLRDDECLLEKQIKLFEQYPEIKDILVIGGYKFEQLENFINSKSWSVNVKPIYNPFYHVSNNLMSLWFAKDSMSKDDFLITNGDNLYKKSVMDKVLKEVQTPGIYITIDRKKEYDDDDMKVTIRNGTVIYVSKTIPSINANAESVGLAKIVGKESRGKIIEVLDTLSKKEEYINKFWLDIFNVLAERGEVIKWVEIDEKEWQETDFHPDIETIEKILLQKKI